MSNELLPPEAEFETIVAELEMPSAPITVEIDAELENALQEMQSLEAQLSQNQTEDLLSQCKESVVNTIMSEFGLFSLFLRNQDGGNVQTIHNAQQKIYADEKFKYDRKRYTNTKNSDGKKFAGDSENSVGAQYTRKKIKETNDNGRVFDEYTGKKVEAKTTSPDHIESLSQFHKDGGFMLTDQEKADFATDMDNLALTDRSVNQSMRDYDKNEWKEKTREDGQTNKEYFKIDENRLKDAMERGKKAKEKHLPSNMQKAKFYGKEMASTGAKEAGKMASGMVIGIVIKEFAEIIVPEIKTTFEQRGKESIKEIVVRFKESVVAKVKDLMSRWKEILGDAFSGGMSAFFSNLALALVNMFATTLKRVVTIVRAGFSSLCRAVKVLVCPPREMSMGERLFEASKILITGMIGAFTLAMSGSITQFLMGVPGLNVICGLPLWEGKTVGDAIGITIAGIITGLLTTTAMYLMDKWRSKSRDDAIKIQLMTVGGKVVILHTSKTWAAFGDAYQSMFDDYERKMRRYKQKQTITDEYSAIVAQEIDDVKALIEEMKGE